MSFISNSFRTKARSWAHKRQGVDTPPVTLHRQRVYILPSKQGIAFAVLLFAMLMGSMNYNNNLGFALTFLLAGLALVSMFHCHRNIVGLIVRPGLSKAVFVGQIAELPIQIRNPSKSASFAIEVNYDGQSQGHVDIPPNSARTVGIRVKATRRGKLTISRFSIATHFPMNLFRAWVWIHMNHSCLVYPKPVHTALKPPNVATDTGGAQDNQESGDDFAGLREFHPGDPPRHIAWKAFARTEELLVRQFAGTTVATQWLDYASTPAPDAETKLSLLCRWILDAHHAQNAFGLRLPDQTIPPNLGDNHKHECLSALALFQL